MSKRDEMVSDIIHAIISQGKAIDSCEDACSELSISLFDLHAKYDALVEKIRMLADEATREET